MPCGKGPGGSRASGRDLISRHCSLPGQEEMVQEEVEGSGGLRDFVAGQLGEMESGWGTAESKVPLRLPEHLA